LTQNLLLFAVAGISYVTGLENGYLLAGAGAFALACGGAVLLFAFWQARRSRDAFRKSLAYFRAVARSDDRSIHNMGDFFGAAAAIGGSFIAVLVAAISSTGWVIGRTLRWIVAGAAATVAFLLVFRAWWVREVGIPALKGTRQIVIERLDSDLQ
jgi:hypothetical protein